MEQQLDENALQQSARRLFSDLGSLEDLGAELSNTIANIYYRFYLLSENMDSPRDVLHVKPAVDLPSNFLNLTSAMNTAISEYKYVTDIIGALREARAEDPRLGDFLVTHALDEFKYHIKDAHKKSGIRRAIERPFRKVDEIPGLYERMLRLHKVTYSQEAPSSVAGSVDPIDAIKTGNLAALRRFIHENPNSLNQTYPPHDWTLLHILTGVGSRLRSVHCEMAVELIKAGADVNCRTPLGWTPLILIAIEGHKEAVPLAQTLIRHGADVGATDKHGADWRLHHQHGQEIEAVLDAAMTDAQREANDRRLAELFHSPKR